ncbi:MAG TPA: hypothetical protein EYO51_08930 [Methylococcaceae bacterium]|jgi:hypothetical protein|nr:hypothetical protein [Methylococcaceae bacterium]HIA45149.1 hypothetical protein [Methylococcaceae bacterium]HIB63234.1 hypothetical protein [Methylococcaceae bacterium]HIN67669.1 hypothetical protein [Methylococcales bacterium]HIO44685.1 hypothetical protein [Methylococcales bacterium]
MKDLIKEHLDEFAVEQKMFGLIWYDEELVMDGITDEIDKGKLAQKNNTKGASNFNKSVA